MQVMEQVRQNRKILACQDNLEPFSMSNGLELAPIHFYLVKNFGIRGTEGGLLRPPLRCRMPNSILK